MGVSYTGSQRANEAHRFIHVSASPDLCCCSLFSGSNVETRRFDVFALHLLLPLTEVEHEFTSQFNDNWSALGLYH